MRKILTLLALAGAAAAMPLTAQGGAVNPVPVQVDLDAGTALGDMLSARDAKDDEVFIGCGTRNFDFGGSFFSQAFCQALDEDGDRVTCFTQNPDLVKTIREINDGSFITFRFEDNGFGGFDCTAMGFSTQSFYMDKHAKGNQKGNER